MDLGWMVSAPSTLIGSINCWEGISSCTLQVVKEMHLRTGCCSWLGTRRDACLCGLCRRNKGKLGTL